VSVPERRLLREQFLLALYAELGDTPLEDTDYRAIATKIGMTEDGYAVAQYLVDDDLAEWTAMGGAIGLTHEGRKRAEELLARAEGQSGLVVTLSIGELRELEQVVDLLQRASDDLPLMGDERVEFDKDLETLQAQAHSPKPKKLAIKAALAGIGMVLGSITLNVAGNAAWEALQALLHRL
jgi:hypothetical protein